MVENGQQPEPKLTRLDAHGFKSFANRTTFRFEPGITAVVGPNGSGKSNISDAVRWVLGETSHSALRSKKTEDVIFAGGKGKAPSGMAEVTVTFNNQDHWLPSEFAEVSVTRRAHRSGDNQYLINGRRVRLKDVSLLTASLGQSYTVVGQGFVDQALSQRAEERRGLFEHAADLAGLRMKVAESDRNLGEAESNVNRLVDLLTELEPRLRRLERQAKQAQAWRDVQQELRVLQRRHYQRLLRIARDQLAAAEHHASVDQGELRASQRKLDDLTAKRTDTQQRLATRRTKRTELAARVEQDEQRLAQARHQHELNQERVAALKHRRADLTDPHQDIDGQLRRVIDEHAAVSTQVASTRDELETARTAHAAALDDAKHRQHQEDAAKQDVVRISAELADSEQRLRDLDQRIALTKQRLDTDLDTGRGNDADSTERIRRLEDLNRELDAFTEEDRRIAEQLDELDHRQQELDEKVKRERLATADLATERTSLESQVDKARNRHEVLQRLHESGASLHAGVRQVMQWNANRELEGIRGTVAELVAVDAAYDTALEVALGDHVQDVVVDAWRHAEQAIEKLKSSRAGRATFQPIDTLTQRTRESSLPNEIHSTGVHGLAAALVRADSDIMPVVHSLLGRTVLVEDLATARRIMPNLPRGFSVVTISGEIARSSGSVTGGSAIRDRGVLGRERELRELPQQIATLKQRLDAILLKYENARRSFDSLDSQRNAMASERTEAQAMRRERSAQRSRLEAWRSEVQREQDESVRRQEVRIKEREDQERALATYVADRDAVNSGLSGLHERLRMVSDELNTRRQETETDRASISDLRHGVASLEERRRFEQSRVQTLEEQRARVEVEAAQRQQRLAQLDHEKEDLAREAGGLASQITEMETKLLSVRDEYASLADACRELENELASIETSLEAARTTLLEHERAVGQRGLVVERARAGLNTIRQRIQDDLELENPDVLVNEHDTSAGAQDDHVEVEKRINTLRERLRRMGYVGEDVVEEYARESEHFAFVRSQLDDVEQAAASLRTMLDELRQTMDERFEETFSQVAKAFTKSFTALFGGGTAKLILNAEDTDAPGGIDIVAQPPGKRLQGLALLSGGERSLTGVALLFAILRVNPSPFVLLDEVDAALDEANVVRFRNELRQLARETQAIVITHNRGTVEIADTLYGVTMGDDGVSQVLSLRLTDLPLDEELDVSDLPAVAAGVPVR